MNCNQFNSIKLEEVLVSLGHHPTKQNEKEAWYLNPFSTETQASFKLNKRNNVWYLHSEGIGGNNIDFMKKYLNASIKEVLEWAERQNFSSFQHQSNSNPKQEALANNYTIIEIKDIQHPALLEYLKNRKVENQTAFLKEIHYRVNDKNYFGIGFKNDSGGYEIRNKYSKICLRKKDICSNFVKNRLIMTVLTVKPKNKRELLMIEKVLEALNVKFVENDSVLENIKNGLEEMQLIKKGKLKTTSLNDFLNEL